METSYFLAANSGRGFYSLYDEFPGDGVFLHIIKGGPGTGKSGFMRRIAEEAKRRGLDCELILCSGDPDSLDGLYIPALKQAWMDGTAPHVREPGLFGVDSDYVNLGRFCRLPLSTVDARQAAGINRRYKALYSRAYSFLRAEAELAEIYEEDELDAAQSEITVSGIFKKIPPGKAGESKVRRRFISALSCRGEIRLETTIRKLCKQNYLLEASLATHVLKLAASRAAELGIEAILCPEPLRPQRPEALILPEQGIYLGAEPCGAENRLYENPIRRNLREQAVDCLSAAKSLHDELEAVYRPYMDFTALTGFTEEYLGSLFL